MRIGIAGQNVRLYPQDDQEQNIADHIARHQGRNFRYVGGARCLIYRFPGDEGDCRRALTALIGRKRGEFMFERIREKV